jgi:hypothetical protein
MPVDFSLYRTVTLDETDTGEIDGIGNQTSA